MEGDDVNEEEIVDEFKKFLDRVSAEDFAEAELDERKRRCSRTTTKKPKPTATR